MASLGVRPGGFVYFVRFVQGCGGDRAANRRGLTPPNPTRDSRMRASGQDTMRLAANL